MEYPLHLRAPTHRTCTDRQFLAALAARNDATLVLREYVKGDHGFFLVGPLRPGGEYRQLRAHHIRIPNPRISLGRPSRLHRNNCHPDLLESRGIRTKDCCLWTFAPCEHHFSLMSDGMPREGHLHILKYSILVLPRAAKKF